MCVYVCVNMRNKILKNLPLEKNQVHLVLLSRVVVRLNVILYITRSELQKLSISLLLIFKN